MIDESILDEIIPVPDADTKMQELKEELAAEGFTKEQPLQPLYD